MTLRRRGFLQMIGGALAAPLMPSASLGAASKAAYPAAALHAAIYHAQSRVNFSVFALATKLGLSLDQAEALMSDMSARGILGPLQGTTQSGRWALSKIWEKPFVEAASAQSAERVSQASDDGTQKPTFMNVDLRPFLRSVYRIAEDQGYALHPRCERMIA